MNVKRRALKGYFHGLGFALATLDSTPKLSFIALLCGVLTGALMVLFRLEIEGIQALFLPGGQVENYEALPSWLRVLLPLVGALLIAVIALRLSPGIRQVGVVHVMERIRHHRSHLPIGNALWQFFGATLAIVSGQSVGREGPSIHLGAASSSLLATSLSLPRSSQRILVSCGVAAAIAASFNTPLAGVIFSMEVIMAEYTVSSFVPVILAAVSATAVMRAFFGSEPAFHVPVIHLHGLSEIPYILMVGIAIGCIAALFIYLMRFVTRQTYRVALLGRLMLAGLVTGGIAYWIPEVMGIGYDTVDVILAQGATLGFLCALSIGKLVATAVAIALGIPAGLIGPTLIIGATSGMALGIVAQWMASDTLSSPAFYAVMGMAAMMAATLQAPLAALTAIIELTANPNLIMPGMIGIVSAVLVSGWAFRCPSVFHMIFQAGGLRPGSNPVTQYLHSIPVTRLMEPATIFDVGIQACPDSHYPSGQELPWLILLQPDRPPCVLAAAAFDTLCAAGSAGVVVDRDQMLCLAHDAATIDIQADLHEASLALDHAGTDFLCVIHDGPKGRRYCGIVRRAAIEAYYRD